MIVLPLAFETQVVEACGLGGLNVQPGSLRVDELNAEDVTVRFMVVSSVPRTQLAALITAQLT